jgi:hypothetical protein
MRRVEVRAFRAGVRVVFWGNHAFTFASPILSYWSAMALVTSTKGTPSALAISADHLENCPLPRSTLPSFQILRTVSESTTGNAPAAFVSEIIWRM